MSNEKRYTRAEAFQMVYASPLPPEFTQPLKLPVDMDISAALKMLAKLIAQDQPSYAPPARVDDKEFHDRAIAKLFGPEGASDSCPDEPSDVKPN